MIPHHTIKRIIKNLTDRRISADAIDYLGEEIEEYLRLRFKLDGLYNDQKTITLNTLEKSWTMALFTEKLDELEKLKRKILT